MTKRAAKSYAQRFRRVLDFIDRRLDEPLPLKRLSRVALFSKYHFQRQFTHYVGITPTLYDQVSRLRRAAVRLACNPLERITDIALQAGFEHAESFSRAFKAAFGRSPSAFRRQPDWLVFNTQFQFTSARGITSMQVRIVHVEPVNVAVLEHCGDPARLNDSVQRFIAWRRESGLSPVASSHTYGVAHTDPASTPPAEFRFDICGSVTQPVPSNCHGIINKVIPGGRCAVVRHEGSPDHVASSVYHLYRHWLPHSGEEPRDFPVYFHYLNLRVDTAEDDLLTDVHLPLK